MPTSHRFSNLCVRYEDGEVINEVLRFDHLNNFKIVPQTLPESIRGSGVQVSMMQIREI
jgi:hypothetical protein